TANPACGGSAVRSGELGEWGKALALSLCDVGRRRTFVDMTTDECPRLEALDAVVRSNELRAKIKTVVDRVCAALAKKPKAVMTWEPIPLETFGPGLPPEI